MSAIERTGATRPGGLRAALLNSLNALEETRGELAPGELETRLAGIREVAGAGLMGNALNDVTQRVLEIRTGKRGDL